MNNKVAFLEGEVFIPKKIPKGSENPYSGPYDITPSAESQVFATKEQYLTEDITVKSIPAYRVANASGGDTFTIGELNG
jgi:hypothetical protein